MIIMRNLLDAFVDIIGTNYRSNLFWAFIGAISGYLITKIDSKICQSIRLIWRRYKTRKAIEQLEKTEKELQVEVLSTANNSYGPNSIDVKESRCCFYISFPNDKLKSLRKHYSSTNKELEDFFDLHDNFYFERGRDISKLADECGIYDLPELIEKSRYRVAKQFLDNRNGAFFNKGKYGVLNVKFTQRHGRKEERDLVLEVYRTDYFTHKVMRDVFKTVSAREVLPKNLEPHDLYKYRVFLTSFGVNALVMLKDKLMGEIIVLSERSILASETKKSNVYHISMNEGLNQEDIDNYENKVRLSNCLERGLWEELGLNNDIYAQKMTSEFHDLFLVTSVFELGISAFVCIKDMDFLELNSIAQIAKDKKLEIGRLLPIVFQKKEIENFLSKNEIIPFSKYIISRMCARKNIFLDEGKISKK
ncbi:MAG: hypothetical protein D3918_02610 [Candidatus Electrothrix sp. AX2]|nr:hypothetical protein [Candidatus Electrothrix gigas]